MFRSTILLLFSVLLVSSCQNDPLLNDLSEDEAVNSNIPPSLAPFFSTFKEKALDNGLIVNYSEANVTAEIKLINEGSVVGSCSTNGHDLRHIIIDLSFWNQASHLVKEMVIFHELGHCILDRGHKESSFANGICRSIMRSGLGSCRDAYISENRDYFIQELFSETSGF